ncbi:hypothetical protein UFOVP1106_35 [uncultured Caudovirales phage]|uniref:Uncharacterized protein n=1 Tax=uncultured Caudovirales phage TaxID=2100421 RepID=A0A6J5QGK1_9CAUD|nr:hypothetical protein UFOVP1106_35 [uncultured Caudovirales phage]
MRKQSKTIYLQKKSEYSPEISVSIDFNYSPATFGTREDPPEDEEIEITDVQLESGTLIDLLFFFDSLNPIEYLTQKISESL